MQTTERLSVRWSKFPDKVIAHFGLKDDPKKAAFFEQDIRTQSYLVRDDAGNYFFAHESMQEYCNQPPVLRFFDRAREPEREGVAWLNHEWSRIDEKFAATPGYEQHPVVFVAPGRHNLPLATLSSSLRVPGLPFDESFLSARVLLF